MLEQALECIAQGYDYKLIHVNDFDGDVATFVKVENPFYKPDDGSDPYIVFTVLGDN